MKTCKNVRLFMKLSVDYYRICFTQTTVVCGHIKSEIKISF